MIFRGHTAIEPLAKGMVCDVPAYQLSKLRAHNRESPCRSVEARGRPVKHERERRHGSKAARFQKASNGNLVVRKIDEQRPVDCIERAGDEGAGDGVIVGGQRTQMYGKHAAAAEEKAS